MKPLILISVLILTLGLQSCHNGSSDDNNNVGNNSPVTGKWKITSFTEDNKDETYHFTNYIFDYKTDGNIVASNGSTSVTGKHYTGFDDSTPKYIIEFGSVSPLDELNEDWEVLENTSTTLHLRHVSGGNGGTDEVVFEKQ